MHKSNETLVSDLQEYNPFQSSNLLTTNTYITAYQTWGCCSTRRSTNVWYRKQGEVHNTMRWKYDTNTATHGGQNFEPMK